MVKECGRRVAWENRPSTGRRRGGKKSKRTKCLLDIPKEKTVVLTFFNQLYISGTFPHLVTCQPTDGKADLVALTLAFPAVFQNFSAEDLHNLIHQLLMCTHVYLRLWGQGDSTKTPSIFVFGGFLEERQSRQPMGNSHSTK